MTFSRYHVMHVMYITGMYF